MHLLKAEICRSGQIVLNELVAERFGFGKSINYIAILIFCAIVYNGCLLCFYDVMRWLRQ